MPEDPEKVRRLLDEEFRSVLEAGYRLAAQSLVIGIEARELRLEVEGDACSRAMAEACVARAARA